MLASFVNRERRTFIALTIIPHARRPLIFVISIRIRKTNVVHEKTPSVAFPRFTAFETLLCAL
jgi:hypothetical protein